MPNSLHSHRYQIFRSLLISAREEAGLTQVEVAKRLKKPQSFVSKYERGERRLDMTEFVELADVLSIEITGFIDRYRAELNNKSF
jgi:transcriptional regulator with XRE-family HTH domain